MQEFARDDPRGKVQMRTSDIPFSAIPHQSRLFLEYLTDPVSLRRYYPNAVADPLQVSGFGANVLASYPPHRASLCDALETINREAEAGQLTLQNITKLREADCVAVVTGQQAGLFSGPLYTIYKALSAVRMADELTKAGVKAVPAFWAATEDHDLAEISSTFVPNPVKYDTNSEHLGRPVSSVPVGPSIDGVVEHLFSELTATEYSADLRRQTAIAYSEGTDLGRAFIRFLARILTGQGLIFLDPTAAPLRELSTPIVSRCIELGGEVGTRLTQRSQQIEADGYANQVLIEDDHFPLFWIDDEGKRVGLRFDGEVFRVKGSRTAFSREDLAVIASRDPSRLSPGVMLRPVVQDFLLPTICYFGGGAEIAYFAQNSVVYEMLGRPVTPIFHRQSFTVIEARHRRSMEKLGIGLTDLFRGTETVELEAAKKLDPTKTAELFEDVEESIEKELNRLDQHLSALDPTIAANLATRRRKILYHVGALRKKALLARLRKDEVLARQLDDLFKMLLPQGQLQERSLNVLYFLNKYGPGFTDWIYDATDVSNKHHRVLDLRNE